MMKTEGISAAYRSVADGSDGLGTLRAVTHPVRLLVIWIGLVVSVVACGNDGEAGPTGPDPSQIDMTAERCLVRLHGRSETGADPVEHRDHAELSPTGNDAVDGGNQWLYDTAEHRSEALDSVEAWIDQVGCTDVVLYGFSNGGGFAGSLFCGGESFDGRLRGVVVDDPVTDEAVVDCDPPTGVPVALYWTGALTEAQPGARCDDIGYTCSGDVVLGIDAYAEALGTEAQASPHATHTAFEEAPELLEWLLEPGG